MSRILFIVNEHPNEALAMSAAKEAKRFLEAAGHKVIWFKFNPKDTMLGRVLSGPSQSSKYRVEYSDNELTDIDLKRNVIINKLIRKHKPLLTYKFHCTNSDQYYWKFSHPTADFTIGPSKSDILHKIRAVPIERVRTIEIKAPYSNFPKNARNLVENRTSELSRDTKSDFGKGDWLLKVAPLRLARQAGITPINLGRIISRQIHAEAQHAVKQPLRLTSISIGRIKKSIRARRRQNAKNKMRLRL